ncbi:DUF6343 family protein [Streptomyces sp. NPDC002644]
MRRSGDEPVHARSALRLRLWLSLWGVAASVAGMVLFALGGHPGWALICGAALVVVLIDLAMVVRHLRQGPHYQPGPDIPPYHYPD